MAAIRLEHLTKVFGNQRVVSGVSLEISDGEFVAFVGPSGCGKTTTLNLIAGLETPTAGDIYIGDDRVTDWEPGDRNLGMVFQSLALFPHMTVRENISFPLGIRRLPAAETDARVKEVTAATRISHLLDKRPSTLSGGEAQRVALARTIVARPRVFLMDEPLSSLDAKLRVEMRTELKRLHAALMATFVYVTHDQAEAMTMADRIVVMQGGVVQQVGPPLTIYGDPANRFVAGFFGVPAMNFVEGEIRETGEGSYFESSGFQLPLPANAMAARRNVVLGVRPEHVRVEDGAGDLEATVTLTEPMGDEAIVHLDCGAAVSLVARVAPDRKIAVSDRCRLTVQRGKLLFFDKVAGARIL